MLTEWKRKCGMSKQEIYNRLRQGGLSQCGALAMIGNWQCESGLEPDRLQGDFSPYRTVSKDYVRRIESFQLQRNQFAHDAKGFGLAQWTYFSRKQALWDMWHKSGLSIASAELQCKFALYELQNDYPMLLSYLKTTNDLYEATARICREFERPAINNIDARFQAANSLKYEINLEGKTEEPTPTQEPTEEAHALSLPDLQINSTGNPVVLLQAALIVRGYNCGTADGIFGAKTQSALNSFKRDRGQQTDGKVDALTWAELLKVGG